MTNSHTVDIDESVDEPAGQISPPGGQISRRSLLAAGAAGGLATATLASSTRTAAAPTPLPSVGPIMQALGPANPALTYVGIDAQQFWPSVAGQRVYQDLTGSQGPADDRIWAGLQLPVGSVIQQMNVGYQGQPIAEISRRAIMQPNPATAPGQVFQQTLPQSPGGPFSTTVDLTTPVTIEAGFTYTVSFFLGAGSSVFGVSLGYLPPTQGFVPFSGPTPRVLDTRDPGPLTGKLQSGEERIVDLGFVGARSALINLAVTETEVAGFVAVFRADITYPGNSSINWSTTGANLSNGVTTAVDALGRIKIHGGANATHVVIDRIGFLL